MDDGSGSLLVVAKGWTVADAVAVRRGGKGWDTRARVRRRGASGQVVTGAMRWHSPVGVEGREQECLQEDSDEEGVEVGTAELGSEQEVGRGGESERGREGEREGGEKGGRGREGERGSWRCVDRDTIWSGREEGNGMDA